MLQKLVTKPPKSKPINSYSLFLKESQAEVRREHAGKSASEQFAAVSRDLGHRWKSLGSVEQQEWANKAAQLNEVRARDYAKYLKNRSPEQIIAEQKIYALKRKVNPTKSLAKPKADVNIPKRPSNPYAQYVKEAHQLSAHEQEQQFGPGFASANLGGKGKLLAAAWKSLSDSEKEKIKEKLAPSKSAYRKEIATYRAENRIDATRSAINKQAAAVIAPPKPKDKKVAIIKKKVPKKAAVKKTVQKKAALVRKPAVKAVKKAVRVVKPTVKRAIDRAEKAVKAGAKKVQKTGKRIAAAARDM
ncbi:hypothetical protein HKX48_002753 [Thoreauomyces humboldtii]|nr:hypothetical protein HKX48_002753 [Thoreauomyces humboldtii]